MQREIVHKFFFFSLLGMIVLGMPMVACLWLLFDLFNVAAFIQFWVGIGIMAYTLLTVLGAAISLKS